MIRDGIVPPPPPNGVDIVEGDLEMPLAVGGQLLVHAERHEAGDVERSGVGQRRRRAQNQGWRTQRTVVRWIEKERAETGFFLHRYDERSRDYQTCC